MTMTLSRTKMIIPERRPEILTRQRLISTLYEVLEKQLALVVAPAGYGKTSLLVDFAYQSDMPVCWLSLDTLDRDPQRFLAYFVSAIAQRFPQFGNESLSALNRLPSLAQGMERFMIILINEIYDRIDEHFAVILDDYHFVDTVPEIREFIGSFVQQVSENCHIVLASRRLPVLADMTLLVAREQVGGFDLEKLTFSSDEIRALFEKNYKVKLSNEEVDDLCIQTEGWITGLHLSQNKTARSVPGLGAAARMTGIGLAEYFDQQVLSQQPTEIRTFLLQTSYLDEFDAELCEAVLGVGSWQRLMDTVIANNLFVQPVGKRAKWIRYHHLFQEFLQARLKEEDPIQARQILGRLSEVCEELKESEKAHHIYSQFGDQAALASLVERAGTFMIQQGRFITLDSWLGSIPDRLVDESPGLLSLKGVIAASKGMAHQGLEYVDRAVEGFRTKQDRNGMAFALFRRSWIYRLLGDYSASIADADEVIRLCGDDATLDIAWAEALRMKGFGLFRLGQAKQALPYLEHSLLIFRKLDDRESTALLQMELGVAHRSIGENEIAKELYQNALAIWEDSGDLVSQADVLNNLGVLYHTNGDYEKAVQAFEQGLVCTRRSGHVRLEALILASLGDLYVELGDYEMATQAYEQAERIAYQIDYRFLSNYLAVSLASVVRLREDFSKARLLLNDARTRVEESKSTYEQGLYRLESGKLYLATGNSQLAIQDLKIAVDDFSQGGLMKEVGWSRLWLAAAYSQQNDLDSARVEVSKAVNAETLSRIAYPLSLAVYQSRNQLTKLLVDPQVGSTLVDLLHRVEEVESHLPKLRKHLRQQASTIPVSSPRLIIRGLGKGAVRVNGKLVTSSQWKTHSVRELFYYLLTVTHPVTKDEIGNVFWPELTPQQLKTRFKNEIYRLRRALGQDTILFDGEFYYFNKNLDYEYDVEIFKSALENARVSQTVDEKITFYQAAVNAVHGLFLEDMGAIWVMTEREHLNQEYLSSLLSLSKIYLAKGQEQKAIQACQQMLIRDACYEDAYRLMMQIYASLGDRPAIVRQYQACKAALKNKWGILPSPKTEELFRQLTE